MKDVTQLIKGTVSLLRKAIKEGDDTMDPYANVYVCLDCGKIAVTRGKIADCLPECYNNYHLYLRWGMYENQIFAVVNVLEWLLQKAGGD